MTKKVKDYLDEIREQKIKQLMGVALDLQYWRNVVGEVGLEEKLRKELEEENKLRVYKKNGEVLKDERDLPKVQILNDKINNIVKAKEQIQQLLGMDAGLKQYLEHVTKPDETTQELLEEVAKM